MAALVEEKNQQMPPCSTSGGITGRKKSANAALLCTNDGIAGRKKSANAALLYLCTNGGITGRKKSANAAVSLYWRHCW
jgi:hypothetical protein